MKTNQILHSQDRELFGIIIPQETSTQFLSISELQMSYDNIREGKGWSVKRIGDIMRTDAFVERAYYLIKDEVKLPESLNTSFPVFKKYVDSNTINSILKEFRMWKLTGKGGERKTWCHPLIWIAIALELNPEIFAKVVKWIKDGLISARLECGINYLELTQNIKEHILPLENNNPICYRLIAGYCNYKVFGKNEVGIRNYASKDDLAKLNKLEMLVSSFIESGYFTPSLVNVKKAIENIKI